MKTQKKIAVVIATYNAENFLESALQSVLDQNYQNTELIVIDGNSKDRTVDIIKKYERHISYWKSEPDKGIYDAWNKAISVTHADWVMFIGSDDVLCPDALSSYANFVNTIPPDVEFVSSKAHYTDKNMRPYRIMGWPWEWPRFQREMTVAHPGALHSREFFRKYGKFDTNYKIVGDYELLLRPREKLKTAFMNKVTVLFREGGKSDSYAAVNETFRASVSTGKSPVYKSLLYSCMVYIKFSVKKSLSKFNINLYLRK